MTHRRPWSEHVRALALELLAEGLAPAAIRRRITADLGVDPPPPAATLRDWRRRHVDASTRGHPLDPGRTPPADPAVAAAARAEALAYDRARLSEDDLRRLARPSLEAIALRLDRNAAAEPLVDAAVERWRDALAMRATAAEFGEQAVRDAAGPVREAMAELEALTRLLVPTGQLVTIVSRSIADHLALEGLADDDADLAPLSIVLTVPDAIAGEIPVDLAPDDVTGDGHRRREL